MLHYSPLCDTDPVLYARYLTSWSDVISKCESGTFLVGRCVDKFQGSFEGRLSEAAGFVDGGGIVDDVDSVIESGSRDRESHTRLRVCDGVVVVNEDVARVGFEGVCNKSGERSLSDGLDRVEFAVGDSAVRAGKLADVPDDGLSSRVGSSSVQGNLMKGRNYARNKKKALKRKVGRVASVLPSSSLDAGSSRELTGAFSYCGADVRKELQESRARMLIAENEAKAAKASSAARHFRMVNESRVNETKFELDRLTVEEKLRKISATRLGLGYVEGTVCSGTTSSLSSGSVSPNSSISMAEVRRKDDLIASLSRDLASERKKLAQISSDKANADRLLAGSANNRRIREDLSSRLDDNAFARRCHAEGIVKIGSAGASGYSRWDLPG